MVENLVMALNVLEKCLNYDQCAILCNDVLDEPGQTNLPLSWRDFIQDPNLVQLLFRLLMTEVRNSASTTIKVKCAQTLQHLAYVRHTIFADAQSRQAYVTNFMSQLIRLI